MTEPTQTRRRVAILFDTVPPWLTTNLNTAAQWLDVTAVEVFPPSTNLAHVRQSDEAFDRIPVAAGDTLTASIGQTLGAVRPDAVVVLGWSGKRDLSGLRWCLENNVPAIVTSDSNAHDFARRWWKEKIKEQLIGLYSAAWAAGTMAAKYLAVLGMPDDRIVTGPVDTIDVAHFADGANHARREPELTRERFELPERYFFASSRLAPEKNLFNLLLAFSQYRKKAGTDAWNLVLAGDGPLKADIWRRVHELELDDAVQMPGWISFDDLPAYYGLAGAFVHASTREPWGVVVNEAMSAALPVIVSTPCGSAADLVHHDENGFSFDPYDTAVLADLMWRMAHGDCDRSAMGRASRRIIEGWTPLRYAQSLKNVVDVAVSASKTAPSRVGRALVSYLASTR